MSVYRTRWLRFLSILIVFSLLIACNLPQNTITGIPRQNKITINYVQLARKFNNILYFIVFRHQQAMNFQNFLVRFINFSTLKLKTIVKQNIWHGKKGLIKY